jgi:branched-subunit amino acid aminotransferase/4-amino-4-deoxychorismate lyase
VRVAQRWLEPSGAQTGIWVTPAGNVSEALAANVFAVIGGVLVTPPLSDGPLAGVTRGKLLSVARAEGIVAVERALPLQELRDADEAIVSATSEPVVPVVSLDGAPVADGVPGPVTRRLQEAFEHRARAGAGLRP